MATRPTIAYLKIDGIPGGSVKKNFEEQISVFGYEHSMIRAMRVMHDGGYIPDQMSALGSRLGNPKEAHRPLVVFKSMDRATPLLIQALNESKLLKDPVELSILQTVQAGSAGGEVVAMKIAMTGTMVQGIEYSEMSGDGTLERVGFAYNTIEWTFQGLDEAGKRSGFLSAKADLEQKK